jgi:hypothetical protein
MERFTQTGWTCDFGTHPEQSPLVGVLVENRDHVYLKSTIENFSCMLPFASLWILHSEKNKETIQSLVGNYPNIKTECCLPEDNFTVTECDMLKMSPEFWKRFVHFHRVLIFNVDTGIKKNTILRFMHFDYIGAMWYHNPLGTDKIYQGNGGFSIRNPRLMLDIVTRFPGDVCPPEDLYFTRKIHEHFPTARMPRQIDCELFSTETREIAGTLGFHNVDTYFPKNKSAYVPIDGPKQNLVDVQRADIDGIVNVTPLVKLGIGPNCLRVSKDTVFSPGNFLNVDGVSYPLKDGRLVHDVFVHPPTNEFHVYYRISDRNNGNVEKDRPKGFCKRRVFENFLEVFRGARIHVIADRVSKDTEAWLKERVDDVEVTNIGNGGDTFCWAVGRAIRELKHTDIVYLCEDDYYHRKGAQKFIQEGLDIADYVTLYDHPDKYVAGGPNPFIFQDGETALVCKTKSCHWKFTNSTTLTFACRVGTLLYDQEYHEKWCARGQSLDFNLFIDLRATLGRTLASSLPGYSTHLQPPWVDTSFESCFSEPRTSP